MEKKLVKLVVYASGYCAGEVPEGCPREYRRCTLADRVAFADWLRNNGQQYLLGEKDGIVYYTYKPRLFRYDVAVVEVDISQPWMISYSNDDGSERVCVINSISDCNEVRFDCIPFPLPPRQLLGLGGI